MHLNRASTAVAIFLALQIPRVAHAGPPEVLVQLAMHPTDPTVMGLRYVNGQDGALFTTNGGATWSLLCSTAMFDPSVHKSALAVTSDGVAMVGAFTGLWHDDGHACDWTEEPQFDGQWVPAFATDPLDPTVTYAVTSAGGKPNGVFRRAAGGAWSAFGTQDDVLIGQILVVAHGTGRRIYLGSVRGDVTLDGGIVVPNYVVRVSDDDGATWTENVYGPLDATTSKFELEAVDPTNPDRIVAAIERAEDAPPPAKTTDSVLVSDDQGKTFKPYQTVTEVGTESTSVAFANDGRLWIADEGGSDPSEPKGLWFSKSLDAKPTLLSNDPTYCIGYQQATSTLFTCTEVTGVPEFGTVDLTSGTFTASLDLRTVKNFVACPGQNVAADCEDQLCNAYCGYGHYAQAPVCCAYDTPTCGAVASAVPTTCPTPSDAGAAGGARDAGTTGSRDASVGGATGAGAIGDRDASFGFGNSGGAGGTQNPSSSSSCAVSAPRSTGGSSKEMTLAALAVGLGCVRRRKRWR
ncbi:MAG TPA: hypothetical protein VH142_25700 [Polyangiaceae bacterium]|nr:hypothetical protein [Polyangiaceae bacterium]